jgi:hypothetical protein
MHLQSPAGLLSLVSISREGRDQGCAVPFKFRDQLSQLLQTTAEPIKLIHANHIDAAFATLAISSSKPVLLKREARRIFVRRIAQLPSTSIHSTIVPRLLKSNDRWNWLSLYFSCASASRELLFAARFAHGRRKAGIVWPVQG